MSEDGGAAVADSCDGVFRFRRSMRVSTPRLGDDCSFRLQCFNATRWPHTRGIAHADRASPPPTSQRRCNSPRALLSHLRHSAHSVQDCERWSMKTTHPYKMGFIGSKSAYTPPSHCGVRRRDRYYSAPRFTRCLLTLWRSRYSRWSMTSR